jgi:signal transduction histidine kinase
MMLVMLGLFFAADASSWETLRFNGLFLGPLCALWAAVRIRVPTGTWQHQATSEGKLACVLGVVLGSVLLLFALAVEHSLAPTEVVAGRLWSEPETIVLLTAVAFVLHSGAYIGARIGIRIWLFWQRLRRASYMWSLTHAILITVLVVASPLMLLVLYIATGTNVGSNDGLLNLLLRALPSVVYVAILAAVGLTLILPIAAVFSFVVARRLTHRLKPLTAAASKLRAGDYAVRIAVDGADEVAQLQRDFNAMAADLGHAIEAIEAERDAVATLLHARRQLIASVSHELRTPVATLRGYLDSTVAHWNGAPPASLRHDLETMQRETVRLQVLIDDLFTLARAEVSKLDLRPQPTEINSLVQRCVEAVAPLAWQSSCVDVVADLAPQAAQAQVDPARTEQIVYNLLHNAIRHTPPGGIVAASVVVDPAAVIIEVRDTGEGIAPADLLHIWERFYRADNPHTPNTGGAGLGLALVKELTQTMGGMVRVESTLGEGSCFRVRLPRVPNRQD